MRENIYYRFLDDNENFCVIQFIGISLLDLIENLKELGFDTKNFNIFIDIPNDSIDQSCYKKFCDIPVITYENLKKNLFSNNKLGTDCLIVTDDKEHIIFTKSLDYIIALKNNSDLQGIKLVCYSHDNDWCSVIKFNKKLCEYNLILNFFQKKSNLLLTDQQKYYN